jgi:hypothetical protein
MGVALNGERMIKQAAVKPNTFIIGGARCGTTFLCDLINQHPSIFVSPGVDPWGASDCHYFDQNSNRDANNFQKGEQWYLKLFTDARDCSIVIDKTADYLTDQDSANLLFDFDGQSRIICIVRDPVSRAYSHYLHSRHRLPKGLGFEQIVKDPSADPLQIIDAGLYYKHLSKFLSVFPSEQIHIIVMDDLLECTDDVLVGLMEFLGVSADFDFSVDSARINNSSSSYSSVMTARVGRWLQSLPILGSLIRSSFMHNHFLRSLVSRARGKVLSSDGGGNMAVAGEKLDVGLINSLKNYYREDLRDLGCLIDADLETKWLRSGER